MKWPQQTKPKYTSATHFSVKESPETLLLHLSPLVHSVQPLKTEKSKNLGKKKKKDFKGHICKCTTGLKPPDGWMNMGRETSVEIYVHILFRTETQPRGRSSNWLQRPYKQHWDNPFSHVHTYLQAHSGPIIFQQPITKVCMAGQKRWELAKKSGNNEGKKKKKRKKKISTQRIETNLNSLFTSVKLDNTSEDFLLLMSHSWTHALNWLFLPSTSPDFIPCGLHISRKFHESELTGTSQCVESKEKKQQHTICEAQLSDLQNGYLSSQSTSLMGFNMQHLS